MSMIAIYMLLKEFNLLDTHIALIIVYAAGAPLGGPLSPKGSSIRFLVPWMRPLVLTGRAISEYLCESSYLCHVL